MDIGLIVTFVGILVAGLAGVLGVWMERDPKAPPRWAWVFSGLILVAVGIEITHSIAQSAEGAETEEAMARVLDRLTELSESGDNPALEQFVGAELASQARSNPRVMKRLEKRVAAKGGDPTALRRRASDGRRANAGLPPRTKEGKAAADRVAAKRARAAAEGGGDRVRPEGAGDRVPAEGERVRPEGEAARVRPEGEAERVRPEGEAERVRPEGAAERVRPEGEGAEATGAKSGKRPVPAKADGKAP